MTAPAENLCRGISREFRRRLQGEYVPRIAHCLDLLGEHNVWQRPATNCNSVGNLLLHLGGNVTQWILATFGAVADARNRPAEFAADGGTTGAELLVRLCSVVATACDLVDGLSVDELLREHTIQRQFRETGLSAVLHVLEHFAGHAGQIYAWTKQATGKDLKFYDL